MVAGGWIDADSKGDAGGRHMVLGGSTKEEHRVDFNAEFIEVAEKD